MLDQPPPVNLHSSTLATIHHGEPLAVDLDREPDHRLVGTKELDVVDNQAGRVVAGTGNTLLRLLEWSDEAPTALNIDKNRPCFVDFAELVERELDRLPGGCLVVGGDR